MSATLTWANSGNLTKTGITAGLLLDDLDAGITANSANSAFTWQTAGKNSVTGSPLYLVLSPKGGGVGRILIVIYTTAPTSVNTILFDQSPVLNSIFIAYFPNGNINTPTNLNTNTGGIMGNDTGATKAACANTVSAFYPASQLLWYFDSAEGVVIGCSTPASGTTFMMGAGNLIVDAADVAYPAAMGSHGWQPGAAGSSVWNWSPSTILAGATASEQPRCNYGSPNQTFFMGFQPIGVWANQPQGTSDVLTNSALNQAWFVPIPLLGQTKGQGFVLKLRQMGFGPGTVGAFATYSTTGPVVAARQFCNITVGGNGFAWFTNFKI